MGCCHLLIQLGSGGRERRERAGREREEGKGGREGRERRERAGREGRLGYIYVIILGCLDPSILGGMGEARECQVSTSSGDH